MQLIMAGVTPQIPSAPDKQQFKNVCPQCAHTKATQRPASSSGRTNLVTRTNDFKIKKGQVPAGL